MPVEQCTFEKHVYTSFYRRIRHKIYGRVSCVYDMRIICVRVEGGEQKSKDTRCSQAVTHPTTNRARLCLASLIGREAAYSEWYDPCRSNAADRLDHDRNRPVVFPLSATHISSHSGRIIKSIINTNMQLGIGTAWPCRSNHIESFRLVTLRYVSDRSSFYAYIRTCGGS